MTIISTAAPANNISALVTEFAGGASSDISMMIGVGLVKDTDAVFFQYLGEGVEPMALVQNSGRPLTRLGNVKLAGISIAEDVGEFNSTKLNVILESSAGTQVMVTSGLLTYWSQSVIGGLLEMLRGGDLTCPFNLDTWRGNQGKIRPCFGGVKINGQLVRNDELYKALVDARADGNKQRVETIMRDAVDVLSSALKVTPAVVSLDEVTEKVSADF